MSFPMPTTNLEQNNLLISFIKKNDLIGITEFLSFYKNMKRPYYLNLDKAIYHLYKTENIDMLKLIFNTDYVDNLQDKITLTLAYAIKNKSDVLIDFSLKSKFFNIENKDNWAIRLFSQHGYFSHVEKLLKNKKTNPTTFENRAILLAYNNGHFDIVNLLFKNIRVKNSLLVDNKALFFLLIGNKIKNF
jgi:hypothetical protein